MVVDSEIYLIYCSGTAVQVHAGPLVGPYDVVFA
jgi:hypothetical protein